jgi:hypothetical protein
MYIGSALSCHASQHLLPQSSTCRLTIHCLHDLFLVKRGPCGRKPVMSLLPQEHAGQLALEVLQSTFGLGGKASESGHVLQPQQRSTASKPKANGQSTSTKGAGKVAAAGPKIGERFSVEQTTLTKYKRAQPQKYHDWQAYKVSAKIAQAARRRISSTVTTLYRCCSFAWAMMRCWPAICLPLLAPSCMRFRSIARPPLRCTLFCDCHKGPLPSRVAASLDLWPEWYGRPGCLGLSPCCWCVVQHEDGRLYFVRESDQGPGTWSKPSDLQDVTEALSGQCRQWYEKAFRRLRKVFLCEKLEQFTCSVLLPSIELENFGCFSAENRRRASRCHHLKHT